MFKRPLRHYSVKRIQRERAEITAVKTHVSVVAQKKHMTFRHGIAYIVIIKGVFRLGSVIVI